MQVREIREVRDNKTWLWGILETLSEVLSWEETCSDLVKRNMATVMRVV